MNRKSVTPTVLAYLSDRRGQDVNISAIASDTGFDKSQIQSVIARLIRLNSLPITVVVRGNLFRYEHEQPTTAGRAPLEDGEVRTYVEVGVSRNDEIIVRDAEGTLYKLTDF